MKNQTKWGIAAIVVLIIGEIMIFSFQKRNRHWKNKCDMNKNELLSFYIKIIV